MTVSAASKIETAKKAKWHHREAEINNLKHQKAAKRKRRNEEKKAIRLAKPRLGEAKAIGGGMKSIGAHPAARKLPLKERKLNRKSRQP